MLFLFKEYCAIYETCHYYNYVPSTTACYRFKDCKESLIEEFTNAGSTVITGS